MPNVSLEFALQEMHADESMILPPVYGTGVIKKIVMEEGLLLRVLDLHLHQPLNVAKTPDTVSQDRIFHLVYFLNPDVLRVSAMDCLPAQLLPRGRNMVFVSSDTDMKFSVHTVSPFRCVNISFTASWLLRMFADADQRMRDFITEVTQSKSPAIFFETTNSEEYRTLSALHAAGLAATKDSLRVKAGALSLLAGFYNKILDKNFAQRLDHKSFYHDRMMEVEAFLKENLQHKFPGIGYIAKKMAMSESSLKRHFKSMFGKSINEHYLELKMDHAKELMLSKSLSVNEVSAMLEYEKPSNFILMFRRFHGISPGSLKRRLG